MAAKWKRTFCVENLSHSYAAFSRSAISNRTQTARVLTTLGGGQTYAQRRRTGETPTTGSRRALNQDTGGGQLQPSAKKHLLLIEPSSRLPATSSNKNQAGV